MSFLKKFARLGKDPEIETGTSNPTPVAEPVITQPESGTDETGEMTAARELLQEIDSPYLATRTEGDKFIVTVYSSGQTSYGSSLENPNPNDTEFNAANVVYQEDFVLKFVPQTDASLNGALLTEFTGQKIVDKQAVTSLLGQLPPAFDKTNRLPISGMPSHALISSIQNPQTKQIKPVDLAEKFDGL